jgi:hypothetical protein
LRLGSWVQDRVSETPGREFAEVIGDLVALTATSGPLGVVGTIPGLLLKIRRPAGASYASNLVYAITAVRNDLERDFAMSKSRPFSNLPLFSRISLMRNAKALQLMGTACKLSFIEDQSEKKTGIKKERKKRAAHQILEAPAVTSA